MSRQKRDTDLCVFGQPFRPVEGVLWKMVWEQRWHPLREEWVIVAAHRNARPWTGQTVTPSGAEDPDYDPKCQIGRAHV